MERFAPLRLVGLWDRLNGRIFTASQVARGKPAPDLFLFAAAQMGQDPKDCLVIEDSLTGVAAARAAGMEVWRFTGGSHMTGLDLEEPDAARADLRFASFAEFFQIAPDAKRQA